MCIVNFLTNLLVKTFGNLVRIYHSYYHTMKWLLFGGTQCMFLLAFYSNKVAECYRL